MTATVGERLAQDRGARWRAYLQTHIQTIAVAGVLLALVVFFAASAESFFTTGNLLNLLRQGAPTLIVAVAMTFVITSAGIDLSVGSTLALSGALLALAISSGWDPTLALLATVALGALIGLFNGWFSSYGGLPPFIVTLATLSIIRGGALRLTEGYSIPVDTESWVLELGQGSVAGVPVPALIAVLVAIVGWVAFTQTPFGQYVVGLGSNRESLRRTGVNTRRIGLVVFVLTGVAAALGGILVATRLGSGSANVGVAFELEVITAVVLGGTSLFGGRGSVLGTVFGALVLAVIANGLVLLHVSPFYVQIVQGSILLLAIFLNIRLFSRFTTLRRG